MGWSASLRDEEGPEGSGRGGRVGPYQAPSASRGTVYIVGTSGLADRVSTHVAHVIQYSRSLVLDVHGKEELE